MILYRAMSNPVVTLGSGLPEENFPGYSSSGDLEAGETLNPPSGGLSCPLLHFSEQKKEDSMHWLWRILISCIEKEISKFVIISLRADNTKRKWAYLAGCFSFYKAYWAVKVLTSVVGRVSTPLPGPLKDNSVHPCAVLSKNKGCFLHLSWNSEISEWIKQK